LCFLPALHREQTLFSDDFLASAKTATSPLQGFQRHFDDAPASNLLSRLLYLDTKTYLPGDILTKVDRMSMAHGLESRVPLLDHPLVEFVATIPADVKFRNGAMKQILKEIQSGEFAKQWIEENEKGRPNFGPMREKDKTHQLKSSVRSCAR
jgi:asparagine synthetase B (glutamine-hydrolysing)